MTDNGKTRRITIHKKACILGQKSSTIEVDLAEAKKIVDLCHASGCIVVDTKKKQSIREISPDIHEITILLSRGSFGG